MQAAPAVSAAKPKVAQSGLGAVMDILQKRRANIASSSSESEGDDDW